MSTTNIDVSNDDSLPECAVQSYRTKDLNLAAFLWCQKDAILTRLEGKSARGSTVFFVFDIPTNDLPKLIFDYTNRKTTVEPLEFCSRQTSLRDLLYGGLKRDISDEDKG